MHDPRALIALGDAAVHALARRGYDLDLDTLAELTSRRATTLDLLGKLRAEANRLSRAARSAGAGEASAEDRRSARLVKERVVQMEAELRQIEEELSAFLLAVPNLPDDAVPNGGEADAVELRRVGQVPSFDFEPADHVRLGERMGILDLKRAGKISGTRFCVLRGAGAALERALASFLLDLHTGEHGYRECSVPSLVTRQAMTGTGQLPKFETDLFRTSVGDRELFLIPTAEVPLVNLYAGELIEATALPVALTSYTRCFRAEAGSYGQDSRGILRQHEFGKIELVRLCDPEHTRTELAAIVGHAEACLRRLGLAYRVVLLAARDTGFSARMTYDLEVWLPGQGRYREVSSCSDCGTFQARRARIRLRRPDGSKGPAATLNGSGLPLGRTLLAILEQCQQADGSVLIPSALVPYTRFRRIGPDGTVDLSGRYPLKDQPAGSGTAVAVPDAEYYDPVAAPPSETGARFVELSRRVKAAGLLELRPRRYLVLLARNWLMLAAGLAAFFAVGDSWWQLLIAAYLGICGSQCAFMWHDAGHKAMFRDKRAATAMGLLHANLINGVSFGWWVGHHNRHHSFPNNLDLDPDIGRRTIIFDIKQYPSRRGRQKIVVRYQHVLFFVLLVWESVKIHRIAYKALLSRGLKQPWLEGLLLLAHAAIFLTAVFLVLSPVRAVLFVVVQQAVLGVYFGMLFAPNHKGMQIRDGEESLTWLERQVLTSRNIRPSWLVDLLYGGLNYQIEHHLFPSMPQMNLGRCREIVRDFCAENHIDYHEVGFFASYREVGRFLRKVSAPVRRGPTGPAEVTGKAA